ncbi:hypothetical protein D9M70_560890 [compost metagenome]
MLESLGMLIQEFAQRIVNGGVLLRYDKNPEVGTLSVELIEDLDDRGCLTGTRRPLDQGDIALLQRELDHSLLALV